MNLLAPKRPPAPASTGASAFTKAPPPQIPSLAGFRHALPWLMASLGLSLTALLGPVRIWALAVFLGCAVWRLLLERNRRPLPSMLVRMAVFLPTAACVLLTFGAQHPGAAGMLNFLVALLALKILELRTHRDFLLVALLGYFMILSAFFFNQGLLLSLYLAVAVVSNTVALIRCHDGGRKYARRAAVRLALGLMLQAIPLVILLFVIFPRVHWFFQLGAATGQTGMSDHLEPGAFGSLVQSNEIAFRVSTPTEIPARNLYWRGLVLSFCESPLSWRTSDIDEPTPPEPAANSRRVDQTITIGSQEQRWLFALDRPIKASADSTLHPVLNVNGALRSSTRINKTSVYKVTSDLSPVSGAESPTLPNPVVNAYTHLPKPLSPRVQALVNKWQKAAAGKTGAARENEIINQARLFFRDGDFTYTLNPGVLPPLTALDHFLFRSKRGFCEHYAAAFSTLMRAAGLPARIVVGYQGGEYNTWGAGHYTIHQSDAHAWSEVWITGRGWQREDPTAVVAPERVSFGAESYEALTADGPLTAESRLERLTRLNSPGTLRWLVRTGVLAWDGIDQQWNMLVLGYDQDRQADALQDMGLGNLGWIWGAALAVTTAFSLLAVGALGVHLYERAHAGKADPAARLYHHFCRRVARLTGVQRAPSEGPLDFSRRATGALPGQARQIKAITDLYVLSRYTPQHDSDLDGRTLDALSEAIAGFRRSAVKPAAPGPA